MTKLNKRKCKQCGEVFQKTSPLQMVCSVSCSYAYAKTQREKKEKKEWNKKKKELKEKLKTRSDYEKEVQTVFNKWIRLRDKNEPCISCQRHHKGQYHAGHYRTVGSNPQLRFEPLNCHKQCSACNNHLSGNIVEYRINLLKKIGKENIEWLESEHEPKKLTIPELILLKEEYKEKIRKLEQ